MLNDEKYKIKNSLVVPPFASSSKQYYKTQDNRRLRSWKQGILGISAWNVARTNVPLAWQLIYFQTVDWNYQSGRRGDADVSLKGQHMKVVNR